MTPFPTKFFLTGFLRISWVTKFYPKSTEFRGRFDSLNIPDETFRSIKVPNQETCMFSQRRMCDGCLYLTGACCEVTEGLMSPWIPNGWQWGGRVSPHNPVWSEFYTTTSVQQHDLPTSLVNLKLAGPLSGAGDC